MRIAGLIVLGLMSACLLVRPIDRRHRDFCRHNPKDSSCQKGEK